MKLPNGYGSVSKIGGDKKRRNPWRARVTDRWEWSEEKGKYVQKYRTIGYYAKKADALQALAEYNKAPVARGTADVTFANVYELWSAQKYEEISNSLKAGYKVSYGYSKDLHNMRMKDIKIEHLETIMGNMKTGNASQKILKVLWNQLFDYAIKHDIIHKNYAEHVKTKDKGKSKSDKHPLSRETIDNLWKIVDTEPGIDTVLIMIYTGMRPAEMLTIEKENIHLDERYMIGGIKTESGIDRIIPIHERIVPLIEKVYLSGEVELKRGNERATASYQRYARAVWNPIKKKGLLEEATPHACRHTAVTLMTEAGIDIRTIKKIVGHSSQDVTDRYTSQSIEFLIKEVNKLK